MSPHTPGLRTYIRRKVLLGFGLIFAVLAVIAFLSFRSNRRYMQTAEDMARARQVLEVEERARRNLVELEILRLRYFIARDEALLEEYVTAQEAVEQRMLELGALVADSPSQEARLTELAGPLENLFALHSAEIEAQREAGPVPVVSLLDRAKTSELTESIERTFTEFEREQNRVLKARAGDAERIGRENLAVILVGTALTFVALCKAGSMIFRDIAARRRAEEALASEHNLLSSIIDTMPDHVFVKDVKGRYILDNAAHRRYLGLPPDAVIEGTTAADHFPPETVERLLEIDRQLLETGKPMLNLEMPVERDGAGPRWLETSKVPLRDTDGTIVGVVGINSDISERKLAEEKLKRFAEQLARSNAELQNFANVASHDLQEPLRKIQAFGDRLRAKCSAQLSDVGLDYLGRMESAAQRMQALIQDLLKLSRVVTQAQPFVPCDLEKIIRDVVGDLVVLIEKKGAQIEIGPLPTVEGDPLQLWQLFQNLLSNSMKFQRPGERPIIHITGRVFEAPAHIIPGAQAGDRVAEIAVRDNGIGFEERFAEQIFAAFQRLHSRDEYEGTGMGLAVCRKITDRHAGHIVAKGAVGKGATFFVTLPVRQPSLKPHE
jgi:PAS domain S-box-containing protein